MLTTVLIILGMVFFFHAFLGNMASKFNKDKPEVVTNECKICELPKYHCKCFEEEL